MYLHTVIDVVGGIAPAGRSGHHAADVVAPVFSVDADGGRAIVSHIFGEERCVLGRAFAWSPRVQEANKKISVMKWIVSRD